MLKAKDAEIESLNASVAWHSEALKSLRLNLVRSNSCHVRSHTESQIDQTTLRDAALATITELRAELANRDRERDRLRSGLNIDSSVGFPLFFGMRSTIGQAGQRCWVGRNVGR